MLLASKDSPLIKANGRVTGISMGKDQAEASRMDEKEGRRERMLLCWIKT